jgi:phosphopantetheine adenylyltransferase
LVASVFAGTYDKWWSGHMGLLHLAARHARVELVYLVPLLLLQSTTLLASRMHYTSDVLLGVIGAELIFRRQR